MKKKLVDWRRKQFICIRYFWGKKALLTIFNQRSAIPSSIFHFPVMGRSSSFLFREEKKIKRHSLLLWANCDLLLCIFYCSVFLQSTENMEEHSLQTCIFSLTMGVPCIPAGNTLTSDLKAMSFVPVQFWINCMSWG